MSNENVRKTFIIWLTITFIACLIFTALLAARYFPQSMPFASSEQLSTHIPYHPATEPAQTVHHPTLTSEPPRILPTPWVDMEEYIVQQNDTLAEIAMLYGVDVNTIIEYNEIPDPNALSVGQALIIPPPPPQPPGPDFKIIPDSELVAGPINAVFDLPAYIQEQKGYLRNYQEYIDGERYDSADIISRVSSEYSVNPRLLLAILEYQSGWVTRPKPPDWSLEYPVGQIERWREGLYQQLSWTANNLNYGYYAWRLNSIYRWVLLDGNAIPAAPTINAGTAGVQYLMSLLKNKDEWEFAVTEPGIFLTYQTLFGYPFDLAIEPLLPPSLEQPPMQLPFEDGQSWSFTGGPHGGWGDGSAWAALDFAPPGEPIGCVLSESWVVAAADGLITYSNAGVVLQDLDSDSMEQTGWTLLYLHIDSQERVPSDTFLYAGERLGHPSCEGGLSNGTHVHIARRYNGEWVPADGPIPFNLDDWISEGTGVLYDGYLRRGENIVEAWDKFVPENQIQR
jgi:LasA protease